jgi:colicin import membrane protein
MTEMPSKELVSIENMDALAVFTTPGAIDPILDKVRKKIEAFVPDMSTEKGRKEIASIAYKVTQSKTYLDAEGKKLNDVQKEVPKKIDATRRRIRETLDKWAEEVRAPLTEWETKEKNRVTAHKDKLGLIAEYANSDGCSAEGMERRLKEVEAFPLDEKCEEFIEEYKSAIAKTLAYLRDSLAARRQWEADQAELERLRAAEAAQKQKEREEQIAKEASEKAKKAAEDAARAREADLKLAAEQAERRAEQAEAKARAQALDEARKQAEESEKREANKRHCAKINREVLAALVAAGVYEDTARKVVELIAKKEIPHTQIIY